MSDPSGFELSIPPEMVGGVYADVVMVWHNQHTFTLDFVTQSRPDEPGRGHIVARVRLPPSVIFQVARAIADNVDRYEQSFGKVPATDGAVEPPPEGASDETD